MAAQILKKKIIKLLASERGFSLVELLTAIVLLALLVGPFLTMFVQTAKSNQLTQKIDDATFVANSEMEYLYNLSTTTSLSNLPTQIAADNVNYQPVSCSVGLCYTKQVTNHFIYIQLKTDPQSSTLEDVLVQVYKTSAKAQLQAQMESVYAWKS